MGECVFDVFPEHIACADKILGYPVKDVCRGSNPNWLYQTEYVQPLLYVIGTLCYLKKAKETNKKPNYLLGHSLGEYIALYAAGVFDFVTGLLLVKQRSKLMAGIKDSGMLAVIGLKEAEIVECLAAHDLQKVIAIANYNSPKQIVVSGPLKEIAASIPLFKKKGGHCVQLRVSGAFHSWYMGEAKEKFELFLKQFKLNKPEIPVISNVTARPYGEKEVELLLADQIVKQVRWTESIEYLLGQGETIFEEVGNTNVLTKLITQIKDNTINFLGTPTLYKLQEVIENKAQQEAKGATASFAESNKNKSIVWNENDLLEFAQGKVSNVLGEQYRQIDSHSRCVRLPTPPYLLVSRVTKLGAKMLEYKPAFIQTEYDVLPGTWYLVDNQIPTCVTIESGQCDLLLISYLGIDFENKGVRVYRLLDCTLLFLDELPKAGDTIRYDISINSFSRTKSNLLFFFSYDCYVGDKLILKMRNGCAGFFSDDDLAQGRGIVKSQKEILEKQKIQKRIFTPILNCAKKRFDRHDLLAIGAGDLVTCFNDKNYEKKGKNSSLKFPHYALMMLDRVVLIELRGGSYGLGYVVAEKDLELDHWYFPCHFKGDQVLAGSLVAEGCMQLLQFYMLYLGLHTLTQDARFQPVFGIEQVVRCRGQIQPTHGVYQYRMEVVKIETKPNPCIVANMEIVFNNKVVVDFRNIGVQLKEKSQGENADIAFSESHINEFATGKISRCFGEEFLFYDSSDRRPPRTPNGHLQLMSRITKLAAKRREFRPQSSLISEYDVPKNAWFYEENSYPTLPYSICMEIALQPCGFLSAYLGSTLIYPDIDFCFRNLDGKAKMFHEIDLRGKTVVNQVTLISSSIYGGTIIQRYQFQLSCGGQVFYQGDTSFGYFTPDALKNQLGLDNGKYLVPWIDANAALPFEQPDQVILQNNRQSYFCLPHGKLDMLDEIKIKLDGGKHNQGYVFAKKSISPDDWFFPCHFYLDPVMPGSLGIEAMMCAIQSFAVVSGYGSKFKNPRFAPILGRDIVWKYRGQINQEQKEMFLEIHITTIEETPEGIVIVGDASLWKPTMRIYEAKQIGIMISDAM